MERTGLKHIDQSDAQLVELAIQGGSQPAYFTLYARYHKAVRAHISRFINNQEEIEDICMESFEKAFKQLSSFKTDGKFLTWIMTIARNTALDHKSKEKVRGKKLDVAPLDGMVEAVDVVDSTKSPEEEIIESQDREGLDLSINGLSQLYRDIAKMCFIDNLGYKEIAEKTQLPINTVKTRISRAKSQLLKMMQEME